MLATGLTAIIGVQAFIIIGGVIRVVPLTGITLPFVSYGGSSLLANYVLLALLIRISDSAARQLGEVPDTLTIGERLDGPRPRQRGAAERGARSERPREQADPAPRARAARLLRDPVRPAQRDPGAPGRRRSTPTCATSARPSGTSTGPAARSSPPTAWSSPRPCRAAPGDKFKLPAHVPEARLLQQHHRLLHVRLRRDAARAHPGRRADGRHGRAAGARPAEHPRQQRQQPAACSW